jgi:glycosyltransferase involved in cell wall biosynthesis
MIRVGFVLNNSSENWMGGINYFRNLFYALSTLDKRAVEPVVFCGYQMPEKILASFASLAEIHRVSVCDRFSLPFVVRHIGRAVFSSDAALEYILRRYRIDIFSHSMVFKTRQARTIGWIPDFQHVHLQHFFSQNELRKRNQLFHTLAQTNDMIVFSSNNALDDFCRFAPDYSQKARVLHFVAQPDRRLLAASVTDGDSLRRKYSFSREFFYLPNQLWAHKNHQVVIRALSLLKAQGIEPTLVCSGSMDDYRCNDHLEKLKAIIDRDRLSVRFLGMIPYDDVIGLMKESLAVINPSLFEGWSSTVEECKSIDKNMILSDIGVHREQAHPKCVYFNPDDSESLAKIMADHITGNISYRSDDPATILQRLEARTREFAGCYVRYLNEVMKV